MSVAVTIQRILNEGFASYAAKRHLPLRVWKAASALQRCRTGELGAHAVVCGGGHLIDVRANSCRHRACPQCGWRRATQWLERWQSRLLPSAHFHVIFTLPELLRVLWRWNRRCMAEAFFQAASESLLQLLAEQRHLGARPGILMGLHTWGSALPLHPHLHCLVSAGGMRPDGRWQNSRPNFLVWGPVLRQVFRGKLIAALRRLHAHGRLRLPPDMDDAALHALLHEAGQLTWHVRIEPQYAHGAGLVKYLARYLRGGPIKNHRLVAFGPEGVRFRHKQTRPNGAVKWRSMQLSVDEFLDRLFEHIPPSGLHVVRGYGLYSRSERAARESCCFQLEPRWLQPPPRLAMSRASERCPRCGAAVRTWPLPRFTDARGKKPMSAHAPPLQQPASVQLGVEAANARVRY